MGSSKHCRGRQLVHGEAVATAGHSREFVLAPRRGTGRAPEGSLPPGVRRRWYFGRGGFRVGLQRNEG
jgi:hypothetical protein